LNSSSAERNVSETPGMTAYDSLLTLPVLTSKSQWIVP
jgi:hypothetical protein